MDQNTANQKITLTMGQLQTMLIEQKKLTGEYITRNLSTYTWFNQSTDRSVEDKKIDIDKAKYELQVECAKSPYHPDFDTLCKYLK